MSRGTELKAEPLVRLSVCSMTGIIECRPLISCSWLNGDAMFEIATYAALMIFLITTVVWGFRSAPKDPQARYDLLLRRGAITIIIVLMMQFFVGLAVNLWIAIPGSHAGSHAANYFQGVTQGVVWVLTSSGIVLLVLHVIIALLLVATTIGFTISALSKRNRFWILANSLGALFIQAAFFNGASFLNYNEQLSSLLMEIFFVMAISIYLWALYASKPIAVR
jgi:hypothetical protein